MDATAWIVCTALVEYLLRATAASCRSMQHWFSWLRNCDIILGSYACNWKLAYWTVWCCGTQKGGFTINSICMQDMQKPLLHTGYMQDEVALFLHIFFLLELTQNTSPGSHCLNQITSPTTEHCADCIFYSSCIGNSSASLHNWQLQQHARVIRGKCDKFASSSW